MGAEHDTGTGQSGRIASLAARLPEYPSTSRLRYALGGALALVVVVRLLTLPAVFQDGAVVLTSNDPYLYRYWVDLVHAEGLLPWEYPTAVANGEPLLVAVLWLASLPFGAGRWASGFVIAWYPVVSALLTAYLVYALGTRVSGDPRVGLAAVVVLAVTPAHAYRTVLGFADHHAFDYPWLALTVYALVVLLARGPHDGRKWPTVGALGLGIAGQVLAWEAGPLLIVPVGFAVAAASLFVVPPDPEPSSPLAPVVMGVGAGAGLVAAAHLALGWHSPVVAASVGLLFVGSLAVLVLTAVVRRTGLPWPALLAAELAVFAVGLAVAWRVAPDLVVGFERGIAFLTSDTGIGEMSSLGEAYGPALDLLIILGFAPFLALVGLPLAVRAALRERDPAWIVVVVYGGYFAALTLLQRRFGGELAALLAVLGGFGFLAFLSWLDLVRTPVQLRSDPGPEAGLDPPVAVPDRTRLALIGGLSAVLVGSGTLFSGLISRQTAIQPKAFGAAEWMRAYAERRGWEYPENYVLSEWGRNRMYNYVVNGESRAYNYARRNYESFLFTSDGAGWYEEFAGRVGFVVTREFEAVENARSFHLYTRLHDHFGSASDGAPGVGHYRAVYSSRDGEYKVFTVVPGATITGSMDATRVATDVSIDGAEFEYVRGVDPDGDGSASVTVAHPGEYRVGDRRVSVTERAVRTGDTIRVE